MLELVDVRVSYGTTEAVRGITFRIDPGEVVGLLGPNGAGKTSTLRAICGQVPFTGTITFDGEPVTVGQPERIARRGLIHVPEGRHIFPTLSVQENLQIAEVARNGRRPEFGYDDVMDLFPALPKLVGRDGYTLSGGEQQMVAIGRGLLAAPRLLLLDEPSLGLAPVVASAMFAGLDQVRRRVPMMIVEQNTALALGSCDRAMVMNTGQIVLEGAAESLQDRTALLATYLGQRDAFEPDSITTPLSATPPHPSKEN
ncbi:MAG TPA: ABC transporter ATP-binding protein [Mycobacteriales bacterium]|nr:ABC transporter ATP-binding protein [Mycobacteriales bacterium]